MRMRIVAQLLLGFFLVCLGPGLIQADEIKGIFSILHSDSQDGESSISYRLFYGGRTNCLNLSPEIEKTARNFEGKRVKIQTGDNMPLSIGSNSAINVKQLEIEDDLLISLPSASTERKAAVLLVKFSNGSFSINQSKMSTVVSGEEYPYLKSQIKKLSLGQVSLTTDVYSVGIGSTGNYDFNGNFLAELSQDAADAAVQQGIDLLAYDSILFIFNDDIGCCAWGGATQATISGNNKIFKAAWIPASWIQGNVTNVWILAHEFIGHGLFGYPHTLGPKGDAYTVGWCPMGGSGCTTLYTGFGCLPTYFNTPYSAFLGGFIPASKIYTSQPKTKEIIKISCGDKALTAEAYPLVVVSAGTNSKLTASAICRSGSGTYTDYPENREGIIFYNYHDYSAYLVDLNWDANNAYNDNGTLLGIDGVGSASLELSQLNSNVGSVSFTVLSQDTDGGFWVEIDNKNSKPVEQVQLTVAISPSQAANEGAQWRLDGEQWMSAGSVYVLPDQHSVEFKEIAGWKTPAAQSVQVSSAMTVTGNYIKLDEPVQAKKVYGAFGIYGLWVYDVNSGGWAQLSAASPYAMAVSGSTLYAAFSGYGVWKYDNGWSQLTWASPDVIVASGSSLYGGFGTYGLWVYNGGWAQLTAAVSKVISVTK